nr:hypothetical protein [uncultured Lichenicoccus sp.]
MSKAPVTKEVATIQLPRLDVQLLHVRLVGDSPLICHAWSHKAKKQMLDRQMKKARAGKEAKVPEQDYEDSLYKLPEGRYGFPAVAFKSAAVSACRFADGVRMTEARGAFHIVGEMVTIEGEPKPREDMVRVGMGTADIRYRGEFKAWSVDLAVRFNANALSAEQIVNLLNTAGFGVGVGEWRPERNGSYGMFHVASTEEAA